MDVTLSAEFRDTLPDGVFGMLAVHGCNRARAAAFALLNARSKPPRTRFADRPMEDDPVAGRAGYFKQYVALPGDPQARTILAGRPIETLRPGSGDVHG
jgi:hypothetical protein